MPGKEEIEVGGWLDSRQIRYILYCTYLGTVVGGRRGVEKGPAGGGFRFFLQRGEKRFLLQEGRWVP